ncbi:hypothetical protein [Rheinheimera sp. UJ63]|uniref:hypothetical protein n=1 Tax=Rheinheimera sp. UJ63 TaxID=2910157 RepID=UPI001F2AEEDC|nr:hypothetical protein [Rheinheimera sp. UJ63]MCF4010583.1 hypothetical protein [Rheinheimera sp. UJ63]
MTRFTPRHEKFEVEFYDVSLPSFFCKDTTSSEGDFSHVLSIKTAMDLGIEIAQTRVTLMLACEQLKEASLISKLRNLADAGIRVYLLLGDEKANQRAIDTLSGRCLIRTGIKQQGALLIRDHATSDAHATLLTSCAPLRQTEQLAWATTLEPEQIEDAFRSFCKLFWEHASGEYLQQNRNKACTAHPDGHVITNHSHHLSGALHDCVSDTLATLIAVSGDDFAAPSDEFQLLMQSQSADIKAKARTGVALSESAIPVLMFSQNGHWLLPDQTDLSNANWCLKLSDLQSAQLYKAFNEVFEQAAWQFKDDLTLRDLSPWQQVRFIDSPDTIRTIEFARKIQLTDIHAETIDSFLNDDVRDLASPYTYWQKNALAHVIDYDVVIHPPYCPANAQLDGIYQKWETIEKNWQQQIDSLAALMAKIERQQNGVADKLKGFIKGFLLGQAQSAKGLQQELATLKNWAASKASPAEREQYRQNLHVLSQKIKNRAVDTNQELEKAHQQQQWEQKRTELQTAHTDAFVLLKKAKDDLTSLETTSNQRLTQIEQQFARTWCEAVNALSDKQLKTVLSNDTLGTSNERSALAKPTTEAAECRRSDLIGIGVEQAKALKANVKEHIWKKDFKALDRALANHLQAKNKLSRDLDDAKKTVERSQSQLSHTEQKLREHGESFAYKAKSLALDKQLGLNNNNTDFMHFNWPAEDLPATGTELRALQQKRYLVVFNEAQLSLARKDAQRLNACIVCDKESINA